MTHPARAYAVSAAAAALRAAGLEGIFLIRETAPGVVELSHNARRESTLHVRTDLFDARRALSRAGFDAIDVGASIIARKGIAADPRPPLAKAFASGDPARDGDEGDGEGEGEGERERRDSKTRVA